MSTTITDPVAVADPVAGPAAVSAPEGPAAGGAAADIAVIIPHYDDPERLGTCLAALTGGGGTEGAEILVVDNDSPTPLGALQAAYPQIRFVTEPLKGAANARNRGVAESRAPILAFLDSDCVPAPGWIDAARRAAGLADLVGGRVDLFDETPGPRSGAQAFEAVFAFDNRRYIEEKGFSVTANLVTSRRVFADVGPFRDGLSEDADWCFRATAGGYRLAYGPDLRVAHPSRRDWGALCRKWRRLTQEGFMLATTAPARPAARLRWLLRGLAMPFSAALHLPRLIFSLRLGGLSERLRGAGILIRLRFQRMVWMLRQAAGARI
jgi:glycosyltransferase involved in cell wall biosynthesis